MAAVIYLSYTGIAEPLGESQVLQYLLALAASHTIGLVTFERATVLKDRARVAALRERCEASGIVWWPLVYHARPSAIATSYDIVAGTRAGVRLARRLAADVVHARSYIPGVMALGVKRATRAKFLFDIRGFWPDERLESGLWKETELRYRTFKRIERTLYRNADHVVTLTRAGREVVRSFPILKSSVQIDVIPTCTNLDLFAPSGNPKPDGFTLAYVGSIGGRYLFSHVATTVAMLFEMRPDSRFLVLNKGSHDAIGAMLAEAGVDLSRVTLTEAPHHEVAVQISAASAGIWYLSTGYSLKASCPTKMGEFLACGVPLLANAGVGDVAEDLEETRTGVTVTDFAPETLRRGLEEIIDLADEPGIATRCRAAAEERFSLAGGVARYDAIWRSLARGDTDTRPAAV